MLREIGVKEYVLWLAANDPRVLRGMDCTRLVYDCIDPCFRPSDQIEFDRREREIATRARCVFATARSLWDRVSRWNSNAFLLPNGVQEESLVAQESSLPSAVAGIGHPVVGYLGTVDWRFDAATVREAARALPNVVFCIAGRVNPDREQSIVDLRRLSNVVVTGPVSAEEGKALMLWFDVGFIPFTPGPMNDAINPCKMYMHLRAGSPVVATNIRECRECAPWVFCPTDTRDMTETIRAALAVAGKDRESRCAFAVANSWTVRAKQALEVLQTLGLLETATTVPLERQPPVGRRLEAALGRTGL
jgi:glycosyltransferase involved in cell wall biosynthesis